MGSASSKKCPVCEEQLLKSSTTKSDHSRTSLVMPVKTYDEITGTWKTSTPNTVTSTYKCSLGHHFEVND
jgi:hypothetical protein